MTILCLICLAALVVCLEKRWARASLTRLSCHGGCDASLVEPKTTVTWSATVENHSSLPALYVRLTQTFPKEAVPEYEKESSHMTQGRLKTHAYVEKSFFLSGRSSYTCRLTFHLPARGRYLFGERTLYSGDLLGFRETSRVEELEQRIVVMPARTQDPRSLQVLGGFLGDISVRRFLMEDPILITGFRDYTGREPMKDVSWTRTAVSGRMQVKQYDHTTEQTVMVLLNMEGGQAEDLEQCFRITRTVCEEMEDRGIPYAFRTNGDVKGPVGQLAWLSEGLGRQHLHTLLYGLGQAGYTCFFSLEYLVKQTLRQIKRGQSYLLITPPVKSSGQGVLDELRRISGMPVCVLTGRGEEIS
ncbi:MAG: DUF58 domain-containing protein [Lachnospiraceae bacterium]|jgi:hypothetical protein|nr:DUF58 domain-containing protein [Lachnospiraceae bacterium]